MTIQKHLEHGFSLVSAIFLLVVLAALGTFAVTISTNQQQTSALDILGARAYQAARGGIDWGAYQLLQGTSFRTACEGSTQNQALNLPGTLAGFTVNVQCTAIAADEGERVAPGNPLWVYSLIATATQGTFATPGYVERQISVTIWR